MKSYNSPFGYKFYVALVLLTLVLLYAAYRKDAKNIKQAETAAPVISQIRSNLVYKDGKLTPESRKDFLRYLGHPEANAADGDVELRANNKDYDFVVLVGSKKICTADRQTLERYFPGREHKD